MHSKYQFYILNICLLLLQIEFEEQRDSKKISNWFLVIDSKKSEVSINCENIEGMDVNGEDQLVITYYLPEGKGHKDDAQGKFKRKEDIMECCENALILKTYYGIRK